MIFSDRDVLQDYRKINSELREYDEHKSEQSDFVPLSSRKQIVVFNKIDSASQNRLLDLEDQFRKEGVLPVQISAVAKKNMDQLIKEMSESVFGEDNE